MIRMKESATDLELRKLLDHYTHFHTLWRICEAILINDFKKIIDRPMLDLGSGDGKFTSILFDKVGVSLDISLNDLKRAKQLKIYDNLVLGDARYLPFKKEAFQSIFSNSVIEHIKNDESVFDDVARCLSNRGLFVFTTVSKKLPQMYLRINILPIPSKLKKFLENTIKEYITRRGYTVNFYDIDKLKMKLELLGLHAQSVVEYAPTITVVAWNLLSMIKMYTPFWIIKQTSHNIFKHLLYLLFRPLVFYRTSDGAGISVVAQKSSVR